MLDCVEWPSAVCKDFILMQRLEQACGVGKAWERQSRVVNDA